MWLAAAAGTALAAAALWRASTRKVASGVSLVAAPADAPVAKSGEPKPSNYTILLFNNSSGGKQVGLVSLCCLFVF
jgi:hypothetical protein